MPVVLLKVSVGGPSVFLNTSFLLLVAVMVCAVAWVGRRVWSSWVPLGAVLAWLALTGAVAASGMLEDLSAMPPRLPFVIAPALLTLLILVLHPRTGPALAELPASTVAGYQVFRLPVELLLWRMFLERLGPEIMTFEGRNFDILIALTAPAIAWALAHDKLPKAAWNAWNVAGIALVVNVVAHAVLSLPTSFQVFVVSPPVQLPAELPFVWLPAFLVPLALALGGHFLGLRQALGER
ncbi:MAG: hypothetical protein GY898_17440 [Proteobacteria bacterium]|nr:hypothetical protein [Pseudomonadota bacterium]